MPSVGPSEVLLLLVIALLVLGPSKLPELGRQLGRGIRQFREAARNVTKEMGAEDLVDDLKSLNEARGTFGQTMRKELGLDDLGAFPDLDEVGKDKPATSTQTAAVAADGLVATAAAEVTAPAAQAVPAATDAAAPLAAPEAPAAETPDEAAAAAPAARAPRKRTPKAAAATTADEPKAVAAPRKRTPKAAAVATLAAEDATAEPAARKRTPKAAATPAGEQTAAPAPATPRPAGKRAAKAEPSGPA